MKRNMKRKLRGILRIILLIPTLVVFGLLIGLAGSYLLIIAAILLVIASPRLIIELIKKLKQKKETFEVKGFSLDNEESMTSDKEIELNSENQILRDLREMEEELTAKQDEEKEPVLNLKRPRQ